jgi:hypothetical protein
MHSMNTPLVFSLFCAMEAKKESLFGFVKIPQDQLLIYDFFFWEFHKGRVKAFGEHGPLALSRNFLLMT